MLVEIILPNILYELSRDEEYIFDLITFRFEINVFEDKKQSLMKRSHSYFNKLYDVRDAESDEKNKLLNVKIYFSAKESKDPRGPPMEMSSGEKAGRVGQIHTTSFSGERNR